MEFLRPTKNKIIIALLFYLMLPFFLQENMCLCKMGASCTCPPNHVSIFSSLIFGFENFSIGLLSFLGLLLSYLLACIFSGIRIKFADNFFKISRFKLIFSFLGLLTVFSVYLHYVSGQYGGTSMMPQLHQNLFSVFELITTLLLPLTLLTMIFFFFDTAVFILLGLLLRLPLNFTGGLGIHPAHLSTIGAWIIIPIMLFQWYFFSCTLEKIYTNRKSSQAQHPRPSSQQNL